MALGRGVLLGFTVDVGIGVRVEVNVEDGVEVEVTVAVNVLVRDGVKVCVGVEVNVWVDESVVGWGGRGVRLPYPGGHFPPEWPEFVDCVR